jgi:uncharacterized protein with PIN domain
MRLLADNMLGRLAKWLRFMGYDTLYPKDMDDKELVELSRSEQRLLLTRDKELAKMKNVEVLLLTSENLEDQMKQVIQRLNLTQSKDQFTRCPECNEILDRIDKSLVTDKVPPGVLKCQQEFWVCEKCNQHYWQGSHYEKIRNKLDELFDVD